MKKLKINRKVLVSLLSVAILFAAALSSLLIIKDRDTQIPLSPGEINYSKATEEEIKAAEDNKKRITEEEERRQNESQSRPGVKVSVKPVITLAEQYENDLELSGYVPGIFEDGGVCTGVMTRDGNQITRTVLGTKEGAAVYCPLMKFNVSDLPLKGSWMFTIKYESDNALGVSEAMNIEVK